MGLAALLSGYSIVLALARLLSNPIPPPLSKQGAVELRTASYLQQLCDARDRTVPGSAEEEQACLTILDAILNGGRTPRGDWG
jgi:hypothetical protein